MILALALTAVRRGMAPTPRRCCASSIAWPRTASIPPITTTRFSRISQRCRRTKTCSFTDAFLTLSDHFVRGRVHPESLIADWCIPPKRFDMPFVLDGALETRSVDNVLRTLAPANDSYQRLRHVLAEYRGASDWTTVDAGPALCRGDRGARVVHRSRFSTSCSIRCWRVTFSSAIVSAPATPSPFNQ